MIIRKSRINDIEQLSKISLSTAIAGEDGSKYFYNKSLVSEYYCEPYVLHDRESCFVVEEGNNCCGYIVGTKNSYDFYRWFNREWLVKLREKYKNAVFLSEHEEIIFKILSNDVKALDYFDKYPAHLHINILKSMQGKSVGKKLMSAFLDKLVADKIRGVHLGVDIKNKKAIGFYDHMGFSIIQENDWGYVMGKIIT